LKKSCFNCWKFFENRSNSLPFLKTVIRKKVGEEVKIRIEDEGDFIVIDFRYAGKFF
jgi:hypothetical protein